MNNFKRNIFLLVHEGFNFLHWLGVLILNTYSINSWTFRSVAISKSGCCCWRLNGGLQQISWYSTQFQQVTRTQGMRLSFLKLNSLITVMTLLYQFCRIAFPLSVCTPVCLPSVDTQISAMITARDTTLNTRDTTLNIYLYYPQIKLILNILCHATPSWFIRDV